jgi:hypothetical protein
MKLRVKLLRDPTAVHRIQATATILELKLAIQAAAPQLASVDRANIRLSLNKKVTRDCVVTQDLRADQAVGPGWAHGLAVPMARRASASHPLTSKCDPAGRAAAG